MNFLLKTDFVLNFNPQIIKVLKIVAQKLEQAKVAWVLIGSTSLALQGVAIEPKDIDILTDKRSALKINQLFKKYQVRLVVFSQTDLFQSFFGEFKIKGIKIEVMGELKEMIKNDWQDQSYRLKNPSLIELEGTKIPVSSLKDQLRAYQFLGRPKDGERVRLIKQFLRT